MTFPTTSVLDNFNRANGGLGANWSNALVSGDGSFAINTNVVAAAGAGFSSGWWTASFGPASEVIVDIPTLAGNNTDIDIYIRIVNPGASNITSYLADYHQQAGTDLVIFQRQDDSSTLVQVGSTVNQDFTAADSFGLEGIGSTFRLMRKTGGTWSQLGSNYTDSTRSAAGFIGMDMQGTTGRLDNFGGGTVVTSAVVDSRDRGYMRGIMRGAAA